MARAFGKMFFDLTPDEGTVQQHIGAPRGGNRRAIRLKGAFRIPHKRRGNTGAPRLWLCSSGSGVGRDEAEGGGMGGKFASKEGSSAFAAGRGILVIRKRSGANSTASMICP